MHIFYTFNICIYSFQFWTTLINKMEIIKNLFMLLLGPIVYNTHLTSAF